MTQATDESGQQEGLASQASAKVQDAASVAQERGSELREQGSARIRDQFDQRSTQAGTQVRSLAEALRRSGNDLGNEGNSKAAQLSGQAADRIEWVGDYLEQKTGDELMRDIETFARRRPWMLTGIGMLAGMAAARFMKASSEQRYDTYRQRPSTAGVANPRSSSSSDAQGELGSGGVVDEPAGVGSDVPGAPSDDPLARDPHAGRR
jgi:uncharacterized protein YjbJ (UPF0337 family)